MKPDPICITKQKFKFENEGERDLELLSLSVPFFFFPLCLCCMCVLALFLCICLPFFFFFPSCACLTLFIERVQRNYSLIFLLANQFMEQLSLVFPPQLLISCSAVTYYLVFCSFYLYRCFLNSLFLACDIPTFIKPCSLLFGGATSLFTFQLLFFFGIT